MQSQRHLLIIGRVDEIPAGFIKGVQERKGRLLVHASQKFVPFIPDAHSTELERRDMNRSMRRQDAVASEAGLGFWGRGH